MQDNSIENCIRVNLDFMGFDLSDDNVEVILEKHLSDTDPRSIRELIEASKESLSKPISINLFK
jgi:hypothetical protein